MAFGKKDTLRWKNFFICFAVSLGALAFGYLASIVGTTLGKPAFLVYMNVGDASGTIFSDKENLVGAITSVFQAGAIIGCLCSCHITDTYGRKAGMIYCSVLCIIGAAGLTGSPNIGAFITFRFFSGAGSWGFLAVSPVYCSELAPPAYRGFFVGMTGVCLGLGYATANYFGLAFYYDSNTTIGWRAPLGLQLLFPALILVLLPFLPESPRYLLMMDKKEEAWAVIEKLHKDPRDPDDEFARGEFYQMAQQAAFDRTTVSTWWEMFRRPSYRKRTLFGMIYLFLTQATAVLVINNYEPTFYKKLGFNTQDSLILETGRNSIAFLGNLGASFMIDRFGRRILLLIGLGGCIVCLCVESAIVAQYAEAGTNKIGLGFGVAALYTFLFFYAVGLDAAGFVLLSEIFPNFIRAKGYALAVSSSSLADIIFLQVTPQGFANLGWKYFLVYISLSVVGFIWLYWAAPETNGLPLEEVAAIFGDKDEVMVWQNQIHVDRNTHQLVVENSEGETDLARVVTEDHKVTSEHDEVVDG